MNWKTEAIYVLGLLRRMTTALAAVGLPAALVVLTWQMLAPATFWQRLIAWLCEVALVGVLFVGALEIKTRARR